jgi:hypothetical protein
MAIAHDDLAIMNALKVPKPTYANRWKSVRIEDIEVVYDGRRNHFSVEAEYKIDEDRNVIVGTIRYDGRPITAVPAIVDLIERAIQQDQV